MEPAVRQESFFIVTDFEWRPGQEVRNGMFSKNPHKTFFITPVPAAYRTNKEYLLRRKVELRFESYRKAHHPGYPSRKDCIFLNLSLPDAEKWIQRGFRAHSNIYEMRPAKTTGIVITNLIWYNYCITLSQNMIANNRMIFSADPEVDFKESIKAYWENRPTEQFHEASNAEVLFKGTLEVIQRIK